VLAKIRALIASRSLSRSRRASSSTRCLANSRRASTAALMLETCETIDATSFSFAILAYCSLAFSRRFISIMRDLLGHLSRVGGSVSSTRQLDFSFGSQGGGPGGDMGGNAPRPRRARLTRGSGPAKVRKYPLHRIGVSLLCAQSEANAKERATQGRQSHAPEQGSRSQ
jgi:hypothetical protein